MAKVTIVIEDVISNGQRGSTLLVLPTLPTATDESLGPDQVAGSVAIGLAIRALWRDGTLIEYAQENIDAMIEERALEIAISEKIAQQSVNNNIDQPVS